MPVQGSHCLQATNYNISVAYRLSAMSSLKVSKEMKITGPHAASWTVMGCGDPVVKSWTAIPTDPISNHVTFINWDR
jgi:hypothetical protein